MLAAAVLVLTWLGGLPFRLLAAGISAAILFEWAAMTRRPGESSHQVVAAVALTVLLAALLLWASAGAILVSLAVAVAALAGWAQLAGRSLWPAAGLLYAALSGLALAYLRGADQAGLLAILFLFSVVWATDILAYFTGRALGGPKLAPAISPGKTWSGALGGTAAGVLAGFAVGSLAEVPNLAMLACAALVLSVVSQLGDLFESWVKRRSGVKDSGALIPGHGGVMDRADGLVAAAAALWLIGALSSGPDNPAHGIFPATRGIAAARVTDLPALQPKASAALRFGIII